MQKTVTIIEDSKLKNAAALKLSQSGLLLAVVLQGGSNIRLVDVESSKTRAKLYRGRKSQEVRSLDFSHCGNFLALITGKCKIHLFNIGPALRCKCSINIIAFDETGKVSEISSYIRLTTQRISDIWDDKIMLKSQGEAGPAILLKKNIKTCIENPLNVTVPRLSFLRKNQKPDSVFEMVTHS